MKILFLDTKRWSQSTFALQVFGLLILCSLRPIFAQETGAVYVMTNAEARNEVVVFERQPDGRLTGEARFSTGGRGSGGDIDPLRSQGSLILTDDQQWLLAVNAGSNEITRFAVTESGLERTAVVRSRGSFPVSLTQHDDLVFVLNAAGRPGIHGFRLEDDGRISRLAGSRRFLGSDAAPGGRAEIPVQVGFTPDGAWLVVTDAFTNEIHLFAIDSQGRPSDRATLWPSVGGGPFGFDFDPQGNLLVSELWGRNPNGTQLEGAVSSYSVAADGTLELISRSVENRELATCWLVSDGRRSAFTTNTTSGTLSRYRVRRNGRLRRRGGPVRLPGQRDAFPTDVAAIADGRFLYTLNAGHGTVGVFRVSARGRLRFLEEAGALPPSSGLQGIAAR